jgi:hypothetical protein
MSPQNLVPAPSPPFGSPANVRSSAAFEEARNDIVHRLGVHFANDDLTMDELERRLELAYAASSREALEMLVADLPPLGVASEPEGEQRPLVTYDSVPDRGVMGAIMGGTVRKGPWVVPRHLKVLAIMGGASLDLRQARFAPGVTEIEIFTIWGGVEIIVPPGVAVETTGVAVMGGFEASVGDVSHYDPERPLLRISGLAIMGGVEAKGKRPSTKALRKFRKALKAARKRSPDESRG